MDARVVAIADQLLLIERELRLLGWWSSSRPPEQALMSREPFCVDTLDFSQWLQWIFLPRMKALVETDAELPVASGILAMAEIVCREESTNAQALLAALGEFDRLISEVA